MFVGRKTHIGLMALILVSAPALADGDVKPRGYSTTAPNSSYHSSSSKGERKADLPDCANVDNHDLAGRSEADISHGKNEGRAADLPPSREAANKDRMHMPHLKFDIEVPLPRRRGLPPEATVGEFSVDLQNGTTRLAGAGLKNRPTNCR